MLKDVLVADLGFPRHGGMHENKRNWIEKVSPLCTVHPGGIQTQVFHLCTSLVCMENQNVTLVYLEQKEKKQISLFTWAEN